MTPEHRSSTALAISDEMVRLFESQFGRGPTKARTHWCGEDTVVCVLEDTLSRAERTLVAMGEHERLRETRLFFEYASVKAFCEPIERITERRVRAYVSGIDTEADGLATEIFVLHPTGSDAPSRIAAGEG